MTFGEKLKKLRTDNNLTQDELAEKLYVTRTAISKWESDRGYPNIESLKSISKFFSVTVDVLISTDEVLTIAEEENKQKENRFRDMIFGLLDIGMSMLLFLPFFAQKSENAVYSVSLISLDSVQPYLKVMYFVAVIALISIGVVTLAMREHKASRGMISVSLILGAVSLLLFILSSQPYPAVFALTLLAIKVIALIKHR